MFLLHSLNTLHGGLTDHISSVQQIQNASLILCFPSIFRKGFKAFKWTLSSHALDPKDISFHSEITLTLPIHHPTPYTELVLVLGHQRCKKACMKSSSLGLAGISMTSRMVCLTQRVPGPAKHPDALHETLMFAELVNLFSPTKKWHNSHTIILKTNCPCCASQGTLCEREKGVCSPGFFWEHREQSPAVLFSLFV